MTLYQPRLALASALIALITLFSLQHTPTASAAPTGSYDGIAAVALKYEGTWGGQCWIFVKKVVFEATGKTMGFDYRQGFFDAGAEEVHSLADARAGDIIQLADDNYTAPDADYPGLHTVIVLDNYGDGTFRVIDSNSQWDEMVRIRDDYDPVAGAERHGINYRIYRISADGSGGGGGSNPGVLPGANLQPGDNAKVAPGGGPLNLRTEPRIGATVLTTLADGTPLTILDGPVEGGGRLWVRVSTRHGEGWVAAEYLTREGGAPTEPAGGDTRPVLQFQLHVPALARGS